MLELFERSWLLSVTTSEVYIMRISTIAKLGSVAATAACVGMAAAQSNGPSGISVRVGGFFPTNSLATDLGSSWIGFGVDYKLNSFSAKDPAPGSGSYWGLSADFYSHGSDNDLPVALTYNIRQGQFVYSAGIGPDFRNSTDLTGNGVGISEQLAASYDFSTGSIPLFLQAKYFFSSRPELSGFGIYLGARF